MNRSTSLALALGMALCALPNQRAAAQERLLTSPDVEYAEPFDLISGFRALPDGRVLVSDGIGEVVVAVDLDRGVADTLGRKGKGPGEYTMPDALLPLPGGQTLLLDLGNGRMTTIEVDGSLGESHSIAQDDAGGFSIVMPRASDGAGNLYYQPMGGGPGRERPDSGAIVKWSLNGGVSDTVAKVKLQEVKIETSGGANNRSISMRQVPYSAQGAWAVATDGRIALARSGAEYRLDWMSPDGRLTKGKPISYRPVKIRMAEKEAFLESRSNGLAIMVGMEDGGRRSVSFGRGGNMGPPPNVNEYDWPEVMPPFPGSAVMVAPDGAAWVRRNTPAGEPQRYDVFNASGDRIAEVVLPGDRRLLGFGDGVVYLAYVDQDDLQWLERYQF